MTICYIIVTKQIISTFKGGTMMAEDKFEQAKDNIKKTIGNATNIEI